MKRSALWACNLAILPLGIGLTGAAHAQASLEGAGERSTIDCNGGDAEITGSTNQVTVTGACKRLTVEGSGNVVAAQMAAQSTISVTGTNNHVTWTASGQARPRTSSTGVGNSIARAH